MTVSSQTSTETYDGNGVTTIWPLPFRFFSDTDIFVYLVDPATQAVTPMAIGADYTLTGAGLPEQFGVAPGTITTTAPVANGKQLLVDRVMEIEQLTDIVNQGRFFPELHENVFDRLTMLIQQFLAWLSRALVRPVGKNYYDAEGRKVVNLGDGAADPDAVNIRTMRSYVDGAIAGLVGGFGYFIQSGVGAILRTFQSKMRDTASFLDFGVVGDGVTDDTAKFIVALQSGATELYLPHFAKIKLTASVGLGAGGIAIPNGLRIFGGGTLIKQHGGAVFQIYNAANIDFDGIVFDGNLAWDEANFGAYPSRSAYSVAIYAQGVTDLTVRNNTFTGFSQDVVSVRSTWSVGHVPGDGAVGPSTLNTRNARVFNNKFIDWRNNAVYMAGCVGSYVGENSFLSSDGFTPGNNGVFLVELNKGVIISENTLYRIGDNAIGVGQTMNIANLNDDILVIGNTIDQVVYPGILIGGAKKCTVVNNTVRRANIETALKPGVSPIAGASILVIGGDQAQNSDILIHGNQVSASGKRGIYVYDPSATSPANRSRNIKVTGNNVDATDSLSSGLNEGIFVDLADHSFVNDNTVYNAAGRGIAMSGAHSVLRNKVVGAVDIGIECFDSFWGTTAKPYIVTHNVVESCGQNGIQVFNHNGSIVTDNEVRNCGSASLATYTLTDMLARCGILVSYCDNNVIERNRVDNSGSCGIVVRFCVNYSANKNNCYNNGLLSGFTSGYRTGLYVLTFNTTTYMQGDLQSNRFSAGANQQYPMSADNNLSTNGTAIGNVWDTHPNTIANMTNKSWQQIFTNA